MSNLQEVSAEQLAKLFHHYHAALAHDCDSDQSASTSWEDISPSDRKLKVSAARLALLELCNTPEEPNPHRKYYATAGEAEWGC